MLVQGQPISDSLRLILLKLTSDLGMPLLKTLLGSHLTQGKAMLLNAGPGLWLSSLTSASTVPAPAPVVSVTLASPSQGLTHTGSQPGLCLLLMPGPVLPQMYAHDSLLHLPAPLPKCLLISEGFPGHSENPLMPSFYPSIPPLLYFLPKYLPLSDLPSILLNRLPLPTRM